MKKSKIKLKQKQQIIYESQNEWVCIDGAVLIKANYVELSDNYLQVAILQKQDFNVRFYDSRIEYIPEVLKTLSEGIPPLNQIAPKSVTDSDLMCLTNITLKSDKKEEVSLFYKEANPKHLTYVNSEYLKYFEDIKVQKINTQYYQSGGSLSGLKVTSEDKIIGLVMPRKPASLSDNLAAIIEAYQADQKEEN